MRVLLVAYDNDSFIHWFPMGLAYLAAALRDAGHDVTIYNQDVYHYPETHLTEHLGDTHYDVVGVGVIGGYYQYRKLLRISDAINSVPDRPRYIIGGQGPSPEPEYFLKRTGADVVVIGEGEQTTVELLDAWQRDRDIAGVNGIGFFRESTFIQTAQRQAPKDLSAMPLPAWDLFPMDYYALLRMPHTTNSDRVLPVLGGRGCPYKCNFCYRMSKGIRLRTPESIVDEIRILKQRYQVTYIAFMDELLMCSAAHTKRLCQAMIDARLNVKWCCNGRLNVTTPDVLAIMKQAGCVFINYGIEAMDDRILEVMNKRLTTEQVVAGIEATLAAGISPGYNIIFGNIGENRETLRKGVEFLLKYDDHAQLRTIRPVTPYPGSPLYEHAIAQGMLSGPEEFYESRHVNSDLLSVNFTELSDAEFHKALLEANKTLLENYYAYQLADQLKVAERLYTSGDATFRGFRQT